MHQNTSRRSIWIGLALGSTSRQSPATVDNFRQSQHSKAQLWISTQDSRPDLVGRISAAVVVGMRVRVELAGAAEVGSVYRSTGLASTGLASMPAPGAKTRSHE